MTTRYRILRAIASTALASFAWLSTLHVWFQPESEENSALIESLIHRWESPSRGESARAEMRRVNPEWDFMERTFTVLALADFALAHPARNGEALSAIDHIVQDTLRYEEDAGMEHFMLSYVNRAPFEQQPARSIFVDGEIAMMIAARLLIEPKSELEAELRERVGLIHQRMNDSPMLSAESYPNEVWTFCNTTALAALRMSDAAIGTEHGEFLERWVENAKRNLVDEETGLLISSFTWRGEPLDGPEGSSLWMSLHNLRWVDPPFAESQYRIARAELGIEVLGFGLAKEWPERWRGSMDVDSGPVVPILDASAGSSGLAILGAASFGDEAFLESLMASLAFAAFPRSDDSGRSYRAAGPIGTAVVAAALNQDALFARVDAS